jgi:hypothetical protein
LCFSPNLVSFSCFSRIFCFHEALLETLGIHRVLIQLSIELMPLSKFSQIHPVFVRLIVCCNLNLLQKFLGFYCLHPMSNVGIIDFSSSSWLCTSNKTSSPNPLWILIKILSLLLLIPLINKIKSVVGFGFEDLIFIYNEFFSQ